MFQSRLLRRLGVAALLPACLCLSLTANARSDKPNILAIWGDDIGWENVSAYGMGVMGYTTPNIDSIGMEGVRFHRPLRPAVLYRRPRGLHYRYSRLRHVTA